MKRRWLLAIAAIASCTSPPPPQDGGDASDERAADSALDVVEASDSSVDAVAIDDVTNDRGTDEGATDAMISCANNQVSAIGTGWNHALAIAEDRTLWSVGANGSGQLGLGDNADRARFAAVPAAMGARWRVVAGGSRHSCGIREDGTLWCWGVNVHGQLGTGDTRDQTVAQRVGSESDWVEVTCGGLHSCGIRQGGALYCWGSNPAGQLGLGAVSGDRTTPQRVGDALGWRSLAAKARFNCALREGDSLWCWGDNSDGQIGNGDTVDQRSPVQIASAQRWAQVRMGPLHTCAITVEGALYCWGLNDSGQLGTGDTSNARTPTRVGSRTNWRMVSGGFEHTCAITVDDELFCWGNSALAQLGLGVGGAVTAPTRALSEAGAMSDVVTGQGHTCALTRAGALHCWGDNASGQAALGARAPVRATPGRACFER
ncbi:MAG: hypothetical protein U0269_11155 [Polyangiales bacterium]